MFGYTTFVNPNALENTIYLTHKYNIYAIFELQTQHIIFSMLHLEVQMLLPRFHDLF